MKFDPIMNDGKFWKPAKDRFECAQFMDRWGFKGRPPHDWREWPKQYRDAAEGAIEKKMKELPRGTKIVEDFSRCDLRSDLSDMPWQLYRAIKVKLP